MWLIKILTLKSKKRKDNYDIRKKSHEMYLQKVRERALNLFDDKRKYLNSIESEPNPQLNLGKLQSLLSLPSTKRQSQSHIQ